MVMSTAISNKAYLVETKTSVDKRVDGEGNKIFIPCMIMDGRKTYFSQRGNMLYYYDEQEANEFLTDY